MKNYLMLATALTLSLNAAERPTRTPREWMAKEYSEGNNFQISFFSHCLEKYEIPIKDQDVLTLGCGTGKLEHILLSMARSVHGIDASKNQIDFANQTYINPANTGRLSFEHCYAEDFKPKKPFKIVLAPCSFHWFEDKPKALKTIYDSLAMEDSIFFANIETTSNPKAFGLTVFEDMKQDIPLIGRFLNMLPNPTGSSHPSVEELHAMFNQAGFEIETKIETYDWTVTEEEWRKYQLPLLLSTPGAQAIINSTATTDDWMSSNYWANIASEQAFWFVNMTPEQKAQHDAPFFPGSTDPLVQKIRENNFCKYLFNDFLNRCLKKMQYNPNTKTYTWTFETTMVLARKR